VGGKKKNRKPSVSGGGKPTVNKRGEEIATAQTRPLGLGGKKRDAVWKKLEKDGEGSVGGNNGWVYEISPNRENEHGRPGGTC